jgi:hypothetical protein
MTDVTITAEDIVVTVEQPVAPPSAPPPNIGLVEISQVVQRGSIWLTGSGAPTIAGGQVGDLYLDVTTGDIYRWQNGAWVYQGTFAPSTLTGAEILAELITVDGAGSGLDADLLDGQQGVYYATQSDMTAVQAKNTAQDTSIQANTTNITTNTTNINTNTTAIATETTNRTNADTTLTNNLATETTNRTNADTALQNNINLKANIASPVFTGDPQAPTPSAADNDTSIATTAFVTTKVGNYVLKAGDTMTGNLTLPNDPAAAMQAATKQYVDAKGGLADAPNDGKTYGRRSVAWTPVVQLTARPRNRVVNGNMAISQELGLTGTVTNNAFPADQWSMQINGLSMSSAMTSGTAPAAPSGSRNVMDTWFTVAKASLAASDYGLINQTIEGQTISNLGWGTAKAIPAVAVVSAYADTPGNYTLAVGNQAATYTFTKLVALTTGFQSFVVPIPAQPSGVWPIDNTACVRIWLTAACGTTLTSPADNAWAAGNYLASPGQTNNAAVINKHLVFTDVGLYADPDNTGLPPPWEVPDYATELARCQRYWQTFDSQWAMYGPAAQAFQIAKPYPVTMRATPASSVIATGTLTNVTGANIGGITTKVAMMLGSAVATGSTGVYNSVYALNARM